MERLVRIKELDENTLKFVEMWLEVKKWSLEFGDLSKLQHRKWKWGNAIQILQTKLKESKQAVSYELPRNASMHYVEQ